MTDDRLNELMSPQPSIEVRSLANNPDYVKCPRCWHYTHEGLENHDNLCDRCCLVLMENFPNFSETPAIIKNWESQKQKYFTKLVNMQ